MSFIKTEYAVLENDELDPGFNLSMEGWSIVVDSNSGNPIAAFLFEYDACEFVDMLNAE
jgi:hypothetical protein